MKKLLKYSVLVVLGTAIAIGVYACFIEPFRLVVTEYTVKTDKWNSDKPLKIVVLADAHAVSPWMTEAHLNRVVEKANGLNPDIVLLLGDYVATHKFGTQLKPDDGIRPYQNLKPACGTFAVLGNHDLHHSVGWPEALARTGIPILQNDLKEIKCHDQSFAVAGVEDLWWGHTDIEKAISSADKTSPIILMMHNPDSFPVTPSRVALSVAGHTHGGQIRLPVIGAITAPSRYGVRYARGQFHENGNDLVVSSGLGMSVLPLRFLCPPEITVIYLER